MPWDTSRYREFLVDENGFENPLAMEVHVDPASNGGANLLCIYTGTVVLEGLHVTQSSAWSRGLLKFHVPTPGRTWVFIPEEGLPQPESVTIPERADPYTYFHAGSVVVSLASIYNGNVANNAGWAVDGAHIFAQGLQTDGLIVEAKIAVRDVDGYLHRVSYQATALGTGPLPAIGGVARP